MTAIHIGIGMLGNLVPVMKSPRENRSGKESFDVADIFQTEWTARDAAIVAYFTTLGVPDPTDPFGSNHPVRLNSILSAIRMAKTDATVGRIELVYTPSTGTSSEPHPPVGTVVVEVDSNLIEIPIEQHPQFIATISKAQGPGQQFEGVKSFLAPQPIFRRTETLATFTFSEANVKDATGKLDEPADVSGTTPNAWLKMSQRIRSVGEDFEISEEWQFAENGWDTVVYVHS